MRQEGKNESKGVKERRDSKMKRGYPKEERKQKELRMSRKAERKR